MQQVKRTSLSKVSVYVTVMVCMEANVAKQT